MHISFDAFSPERKRQVRFLIVTILAYLTYLFAYWILTKFTPVFHYPAFVYVIAIIAGDSVNYFGNRSWVFQADQERIRTQGGRFMLVMVFSLLMQTLLFWIGRSFQGVSETALLLFLPGFRAVLNYVCHRVFTFRHSSSPSV